MAAPPEPDATAAPSAASIARLAAPRSEPVACVVCRADDPRPYRERMYKIGPERYHLVRCRRCGLVYVNPRPDGETLGAMYDDPDYYTDGYNLGVETENYFERKDELLEQYDGIVADIERETGKSAGDMLELGSAGGFFLEAARRRGWRVKGIEISPPAVAFSRREMDFEVFEGLLEDAPYAEGSFDVAMADNVLEHTTDPADVLARLKRLLRPGGHLVVIVPSYVNSPYFRAFLTARRLLPRALLGPQTLKLLKFEDDDERGGGYPYHILEFDRATLTRLLREAGFETVRVEASVPLPAHVFKAERPSLGIALQRLAFRTLDGAMRAGLAPGARLRVVARA